MYYNIPLKDRRYNDTKRADIVWIHPHAGILVIEVKAWDYDFLSKCKISDDEKLLFNGQRWKNPIKQAIQYRDIILDLIRESNYPVSYVVYFPNITRKEFKSLPRYIKHYIPENECIFKGDKDIKERLISRLGNFSLKALKGELSEKDFYIIRKTLFPHKAVYKGNFHVSEKDIPLLDLYQEKLLHSSKSGIRILRGVPGSGKTVVLTAKAVHEKLLYPEKKILIITFNHALLSGMKDYIRFLIERMKVPLSLNGFDFFVIDKIMAEVHRRFISQEFPNDIQVLRKNVAKYLELNELPEGVKYDVIIGDESQDFTREHFVLIKKLLKKSGLLVFGVDETQRIYEGTDWKWVEVGIEARGRNTVVLRRSYRNPSEIFSLASKFLKADSVLARTLKELELDNAQAIRTDNGKVEIFITENEFETVGRLLRNILQKYKPGDVFILCANGKLVDKFNRYLKYEFNEIHAFILNPPGKINLFLKTKL